MMVAECVITDFINPITGDVMTKEDLGFMVVTIDLLVVVCVVLFVMALDMSQREYVDMFKDQTILMSDFTLQVKDLPLDDYYGGNEEILRSYLYHHFETILYEHQNKAKLTQVSNKQEELSKEEARKYHISDICFGQKNMSEI